MRDTIDDTQCQIELRDKRNILGVALFGKNAVSLESIPGGLEGHEASSILLIDKALFSVVHHFASSPTTTSHPIQLFIHDTTR